MLGLGCDPRTDPPELEDVRPRVGLDDPPANVAAAEYDCQGAALPSCSPGHAGAQCDLECLTGWNQCAVHYYCHGDGRVAGLGASGTYLFEHSNPNPTPQYVGVDLESWITGHEIDLGFPDGLNANKIDIEVTDGAEAAQGMLDIHRFHQYYDAGGTRALVVGDGSMISVELNAIGVLAIKGTIIDPREVYAHSVSQASEILAEASIQRHVAQRLGVLSSEVDVRDLGLVAVPGANIIGWRGSVNLNGQVTVATVTVVADPAVSGLLPVLSYEDHAINGLANTVAIDVISEDLGSDVNSAPITEAQVFTLYDGIDLQGSTYGVPMDPQLATEEIVTLDLHTGTLGAVAGSMDFDRFIDGTGSFGGSQPSLDFDAQRYHHLASEAYALVDYVVVGTWDSALPRFTETVPDPMNPMGTIEVPLSTDYPPGQFRPRILNAVNYAPLGGPSGQADYALVIAPSPIPELLQQPMPGQESEVVAYVKLPAGSSPANVFMHELGHAFDVFLAPGFAKDFIPVCVAGCDTVCDEDTSDEALPLAETIAQMFALWQYKRIVGIQHDDCGILSAVMTGAGQGSTLVHHPDCMGMSDQLSIFIRPDDPGCADSDYCDKPSQNEVESATGPAYVCDASEGYNVTSILQVWWNALHGQYCEPSYPFTCSAVLDVVWPPGCDAPGSSHACATSDEVVGLAFVYAVRTNPLSYEDFVDSMTTFVACNYGNDAYSEFNQALCDHELRDCGAPIPAVCEICGNGLREGSEQCDGLDLSVPEFGVVPTCQDFGYAGGSLSCDMTCSYDVGQCTAPTTSGGLDSTSGVGTSTGTGTGTSTSTETGIDSGSSGTAGSSGEGGCGCRAGERRDGALWMLALLLGLGSLRRRRRRRSGTQHTRGTASMCSALVLAVVMVSCGPGDDGVDAVDSSSGSEGSGPGATSSTSESSGVLPVWPEDSLGAFYLETSLPLGIVGKYVAALSNLELTPQGLTVTHLVCDGDHLQEELAVMYEGPEAHVRPLPGDDQVMWRGGPIAAELVFRPGPTCDTLELELVEPAPGYPDQWRWHRGALTITDSCSDSDDEWAADVSPEVPTECPPAG